MTTPKPAPAPEPKWDNTTVCFGSDCPNCEREKAAPEPQGSEEPDYEAALTEVFNRASIKGEEHLMVPKAAYLAIRAEVETFRKDAQYWKNQVKDLEGDRAELAQVREERDKFEAESEQKGADLMAAEGVIAEIIDAYERSASSELGQLIEDARAARAKEGEKR